MWFRRFGKGQAVAMALAWVLASPAQAQEVDAAALRAAEATGLKLRQMDIAIQAARSSAEQKRGYRKHEGAWEWFYQFDGEGAVVTFVRESDGQPVPRFRTRIVDGVVEGTEGVDDADPLQGATAAWYAARRRARQVEPMMCSKSVEDMLLPDAGGNLRVYRIQRATYDDVVLAGGSQRIDLSADGSRVLSTRDFTGDCTTLQKAAGTVGIVEQIDPQPNEFHVWLAYALGKPLFVTTQSSNLLWLIRDGKIEPMGPAG